MTKEKKNEKKNDGLNGVLMQVAISIISIVFAFLVGGIIIAAMGENPFKAYSVLIKGGSGNSGGADCFLNQNRAVNPDWSRCSGGSEEPRV